MTTLKRGLVSEEQLAGWEHDLRIVHTNHMATNVIGQATIQVVCLMEPGHIVSATAGVGLALIADRKALVERIEALEETVERLQLEAHLTANLPNMQGMGHA
jgi:hypothetical protein